MEHEPQWAVVCVQRIQTELGDVVVDSEEDLDRTQNYFGYAGVEVGMVDEENTKVIGNALNEPHDPEVVDPEDS